MMKQEYRYISTVFIIGFLVSQFTKNMIVILLLALILANIIMLLWKNKSVVNEGFEENAGQGEGEQGGASSSATTSGSEKEIIEEEVKNDKEVKQLIDDKGKLVELKKDAEDLLNTQKQILDGLNKIEPLLTRAEKLSEKFSNMKP
jgi:hypothetical protein